MSPRLPYLAVAILISAGTLHAVESAPAKAETVPPYELKKRSAFSNTGAKARAPFWPIGWVKRTAAVNVEAQAPAQPRVQLDGKNFKVTSIMVATGGTPSLAVINGRAYGEGEYLRMPKGTAMPPARVRVQRINDGTVILQNAEQTLVATLYRPELAERRAEELLLDPDR